MLRVVDLLGKVLFQTEIINMQMELNLSELISPFNFIQITENVSSLGTKKLIVN